MKSKHLVSSLLALTLSSTLSQAWGQAIETGTPVTSNVNQEQILSFRQEAIVPIAALAAAGDLTALKAALNKGLDAGLTINDGKEVLVQLYAYAGFPRSLNALNTLMTVVEERRAQGIKDKEGKTPSAPIPKGEALLEQGTANQTKLVGRPVKGPLFDFAPAADEYLKTHLFGDIFARDNLSWQNRELATLAMLSALPGAEPQLKAHIGIAMNTGISATHLQQLINVLEKQVGPEEAERTRVALKQTLSP